MVRSVYILGMLKYMFHVFHLIDKVIHRHPTKEHFVQRKHPSDDSKYQTLHF